jgi:choline dehydrogenase
LTRIGFGSCANEGRPQPIWDAILARQCDLFLFLGDNTREILPGDAVLSDRELIADFRARAATVFHPVSTCMMGTDPRHAVVDARLHVHGALNLRVIDSSVFPTVTSGNINAPTVMVAEKGAGMLIEDERQLAPRGVR